MVAEVTSSKPDQDRIAERHCYARAGIPLHLLIDREKSQVSLFSKPKRDEYTEVHLAAFGEPLAPRPVRLRAGHQALPLTGDNTTARVPPSRKGDPGRAGAAGVSRGWPWRAGRR